MEREILMPYEGSSNYPALYFYFASIVGCERARDVSIAKMQEIALEVCKGDKEKLDRLGLPALLDDYIKFENSLADFLSEKKFSVSDFSLNDFPLVKIEVLKVNGLVRSITEMADGRGADPLHDLIDREDPEIGAYISYMDFFEQNSNDLIKIRDLFIAFMPFARELVLAIGLKKYNELRERFTSVYFKNLNSEVLTSSTGSELYNKFIADRPFEDNGLKHRDIKSWVKELMVLAKNPKLVQDLIDYGGSTIMENVRYFIQLTADSNKRALIMKMLDDSKISERDYVRALLDESGEFSIEDMKLLSKALKIKHSIVYEGFVYENRQNSKVQSVYKLLISDFFNGVERKDVYKLKFLLLRFCSKLLKCMNAYRLCDEKIMDNDSLLCTRKTIAPVFASLADIASIESRPQGKFNILRAVFDKYSVQIYPAKEDHRALLKLIDQEAVKIVCMDVLKDEFDKISKELGLSDEVIESINDLFEKAVEEQEANSRKLVNKSDVDTVYGYGTMIRFLHNVFPKLYKDIVEEDNAR